LNRGKLLMMSPPGNRHSYIQTKIARILDEQGSDPGYGETRVEVGLLLQRLPDTLLGPDVTFIGKASLPIRESKEGYIETIPDLVVEVRSKNDSKSYVFDKVKTYLEAGVGQVWLAEPESRTIVIHRPNAEPQQVSPDGFISEIDFPPIPGLKLVLAQVFPAD